MTPIQKLQLRASEIRQKLGELGAVETPTDEQAAEIRSLTGEYQALETRQQALTVAADEPGEQETVEETDTVEKRDEKLADLMETAKLGNIALAALEQRSTDGAEAELQQEFGMAANQVPLAMLETRAAGDPAAIPDAGKRGASAAPIIPYVFPSGAAAFLGVAQPSVPVGDRAYTVMSIQATTGTPAKGAAQAQTDGAGAFVGTALTPKRIQAAFVYAREDAATLAGLDAALRMNLSESLSDKLDDVVIDALVAGGKAVTGGAIHNSGAFAELDKQLHACVDGRYADTPGAVRVVMGPDTYALAAAAYRGTGTDFSAIDNYGQRSGGFRVNANMPAVASKKQKSLYRLGSRMDAVAPIWSGITLVPDQVTKVADGEIVLTAIMLYNFAVLRDAPIRVVEYTTAA